MITIKPGAKIVGVVYTNSGTDAMENLGRDFEVQNPLDLIAKVGDTHVKMLKESVSETPKAVQFGLKNVIRAERKGRSYTNYIINGVANEGIVEFCPIYRISGDITICVMEPEVAKPEVAKQGDAK